MISHFAAAKYCMINDLLLQVVLFIRRIRWQQENPAADDGSLSIRKRAGLFCPFCFFSPCLHRTGKSYRFARELLWPRPGKNAIIMLMAASSLPPYNTYQEDMFKMEPTYTIIPGNIPNDGILFVDNEARHRSGHMGHALVEYGPQSMLAFFSNCSAAIEHGHTGYGWMEYKRTTDGGRTWSPPMVLDYAYQCFLDGTCNISCEKAVCTDDGTIVLFCLRNKTITRWEPYLEPTVLRSFDGGVTWTAPQLLSTARGRVMDARYWNGVLYVLEFCNDAEIKWTGNRPEHVYRLYTSTDNGQTFEEKSVVPFDTFGRSYGAMDLLPDGRMIVYIYNENDEYHADFCISPDMGSTWSAPSGAYFAKRIRNPQICHANGLYFLHGRSGNNPDKPIHFVLYTSQDGLHWDEGRFLRLTPPQGRGDMAYYSNNCVTGRFGGETRILIQASDPYREGCVNVRHWWITFH